MTHCTDNTPPVSQMQVICKNNKINNKSTDTPICGAENGYCVTPSFYIGLAYRLRRSASHSPACVTELHNSEAWWWWWWWWGAGGGEGGG